MLRYLVALWKIRIEIIFSCKIIIMDNITIECEAELDCEFNRFFVHHRKRARVRKRNGADISIWQIPKLSTIATKQFTFCEQLNMNFQADDSFIFFKIRHGSEDMKRHFFLCGIKT